MKMMVSMDGFRIPKDWRRPPETSRAEKTSNLKEILTGLKKLIKIRRKLQTEYVSNDLPFLKRNLSIGIRQWKSNEAAIANIVNQRRPTMQQRLGARGTFNGNSVRDSISGLNTSQNIHNESVGGGALCRTDPVRAFYTVWHIAQLNCSAKKAQEKALQAIEQAIHKPPKGGVAGLVPVSPEDLTEKGRKTLLAWARLASEREVGYESGPDEDAVDMWNRTVSSVNSSMCGSTSSNASFARNTPGSASSRSSVKRGARLAIEAPLNSATPANTRQTLRRTPYSTESRNRSQKLLAIQNFSTSNQREMKKATPANKMKNVDGSSNSGGRTLRSATSSPNVITNFFTKSGMGVQ